MPIIAGRASAAYGAGFGKVLGGGAAFEPVGAFDALGTVTVGSGGVASITFAGIPQNYTHLQIRIMQRATGAGTNWSNTLKFNSDATQANYRNHSMYGTGSTTGVGTYQRFYVTSGGIPAAGDNASVFGSCIIDILDYCNTNKNKVVKSLAGFDNNSNGQIVMDSMLWMNTNPITTILMEAYETNLAEKSTFALYGVK